jgi:uncharacterized protein (TIGR03435 family)
MLVRSIGLSLYMISFVAPWIHAQSVAKRPKFDAVSVKGSRTNQDISYGPSAPFVVQTHNFRYAGDRVTCNLTLKEIMQEAYSLKDFQILGPDWIGTNMYDIAATMPGRTTRETARLMLQTMLADRFGFQSHREQKDLPVYVLLQAKGGIKLRTVGDPAKERDRTIDTPVGPVRGATWSQERGHFVAPALSLGDFAAWLSNNVDLPVVNQLEMPAAYAIDLRWTPEPGAGARPYDTELMHAMEEQLGLRLEKRKLPYEVLVVDGVEKLPTAN